MKVSEDRYEKSLTSSKRARELLAAELPADSEARKAIEAALDASDDKMRRTYQMAQYFGRLTENVDSIYSLLEEAMGAEVLSAVPQVADFVNINKRIKTEVDNTVEEMRELDEDIMNEIAGVAKWQPPVDFFHHFERYLQNHYEPLREATKVLYAHKPDIEFTLYVYDVFDTEEEARDFRKVYEDRFTFNVATVQTGYPTLMGPFKQNRSKLDFYNRDVEVIKKIFEQQEKDAQTGREMLKRRTKNAKAKNIKGAGPDDPAIAGYKKAMGIIQDYAGAEEGLTQDQRKELEEAYRVKNMEGDSEETKIKKALYIVEQYEGKKDMTEEQTREYEAALAIKENAEVPDHSVRTDVFRTDEKGNLVKQTLFIDEENAKDRAQIKQGINKQKEKIIESRTGAQKKISELQDDSVARKR